MHTHDHSGQIAPAATSTLSDRHHATLLGPSETVAARPAQNATRTAATSRRPRNARHADEPVQLELFAPDPAPTGSDVSPDEADNTATTTAPECDTAATREDANDTAIAKAAIEPARPTNFAEALAMLEASGKFDTAQMAKLRSFANTAAKVTQDNVRTPDPARLPCEPSALRAQLVTFQPTRTGMTDQNWSDIKSGLHRILRATGWLRRRPRRHKLSPPWQAVMPPDDDAPSGRWAIAGFAGFCTTIGVEPTQVTNETFAAFREHVESCSLTLDFGKRLNSLKSNWRTLYREHPEFGIPPLADLPRYNLVARRKDELPTSFHVSVDAYIQRCANPDPLDTSMGRALAPDTLRKRRGCIYLAVQYLMDLGWQPSAFPDLGAICHYGAIYTIMCEHFRRHTPDRKAWPRGAELMAWHLKTTALQNTKLGEQERLDLDALVRKTKVRQRSFPKQTRERLAAFDDERTLRDFFRLPVTLWKRAAKLHGTNKRKEDRAAAKYAILLAILLTRPLRIGEAASLDYMRDFRRDRRGRITHLYIDGTRTKNGTPIDAAIDPILARRIDEYIEKYIKPLGRPGETWLFPGDAAGHAPGGSLAAGLKRQIWLHLGIHFNSHLARALIATLILDADPNGGAIAQRLLGHLRIDTTYAHYGMQRGRGAQRLYTQYLERVLRGRDR